MVEIRKMEPTESKEVKKIALKAFGLGIERLFISKPKDAMVALMNGKIVGGINTKYITSGSHKIGYYDTAFIDPIYHGQGIGKLLYEKTTEQFWNDKCTALSALVKDDNVSSWKLFLNNGFKQVSILEVIRHLGITATLKLYFTTPFFIGNGMEHYLAVKDSPVKSKNINTAKQLLLFFLANLIILFAQAFTRSNILPFIIIIMGVLLGNICFGYIGTLLTKEKWNFRLNSGGAILCILITFLGNVFPLIGNWYPNKYENSSKFRRNMGIVALCEWVYMIGVTILGILLKDSYPNFRWLAQVGALFLIYKIIFVYPFESFGGNRVFKWNKGVYVTCAIISGILIYFS